jgi:hypothetical protein
LSSNSRQSCMCCQNRLKIVLWSAQWRHTWYIWAIKRNMTQKALKEPQTAAMSAQPSKAKNSQARLKRLQCSGALSSVGDSTSRSTLCFISPHIQTHPIERKALTGQHEKNKDPRPSHKGGRKDDKVRVVKSTDAVVCPRTVMIKLCNASVTALAVFTPYGFPSTACGAVVSRVELIESRNFHNGSLTRHRID